MYDGGIRCSHRDTECGIYSNSVLTLLLFCKSQTTLKLKHILISTRNKQGVKNQLLTLRFPGSFINELLRGNLEREDGPEIQGGLQGSPLLQSLPKPWAWPRTTQKAPSTPHWTRATLSVWLRPQCILCLPRAELEREEWSCPCVATGLMPGRLRSLLTSFAETCPVSP